jgi:hypothetical protein
VKERTRRPDSRSRTGNASRDAQERAAAEDGGGLLVALLILWYFGFISFHWKREPTPQERLSAITGDISKAQMQLQQLTHVASELRADSMALDSNRAQLKRQVGELERARDQIAISLNAAASTVSPSGKAQWLGRIDSLFTGVFGNLISAALIGAVGWVFGRRAGRAEKTANTPRSSGRSE